MKKALLIAVIIIVFLLTFALMDHHKEDGGNFSGTRSAVATTGEKYTCSMDGGVYDKPGKCPKCGMNLELMCPDCKSAHSSCKDCEMPKSKCICKK